MSLADLMALWRADFARRPDQRVVDRIRDPAVRYLIILRTATFFRRRGPRPLALILSLWLARAKWRFGFELHPDSEIGGGLYLGNHPGGVVVNPGARIGTNCNLGHGVTLGQVNVGPRAGAPVLGDRVWVGAGAKVLGDIRVGDDALIAPNAVVVDDVEPSAVVGGIPAKVISRNGSRGYVNDLAVLDEHDPSVPRGGGLWRWLSGRISRRR